MAGMVDSLLSAVVEPLRQTPWYYWLLFLATAALLGVLSLYFILIFALPKPRAPRKSEKLYRTILPDGTTSGEKLLPCWLDQWAVRKELDRKLPKSKRQSIPLEEPEVFISVVVPAYNEEARLAGMLEEAIAYLQGEYGDAHGREMEKRAPSTSSEERRKSNGSALPPLSSSRLTGWEILLVSDGSTDKTVDVALKFARDHQLEQYPASVPGPWTAGTSRAKPAAHIPHGSIRVISLEENRGKGGAVVHGLRHVRGQYVVFADADGATKFDDLGQLVAACQELEGSKTEVVAIGSRAHLVGSDAVVQRKWYRNLLMDGFHLLIRLMTTRKTSRIKDTQCGFKLFTRTSLPYIVPYMHTEGWIFDVEMLMLAESAGIPVKEVAVGWKEVTGSKLNVIWDSLGMAWGLAVLRAAWVLGVYKRS